MPSAVPPQAYKLHLLGTLDLCAGDGHSVRSVLAQPKRLALLVYLTLARPTGFHRRDALVAMLWPELDSQHARNSLSQALSYLRRSLGEDVFQTRGAEEVALTAGRLLCDAAELEAALEAGADLHAVNLYDGDLLPGFHLPDAPEFERWLEAERTRLRDRYAAVALRLSAEAEETGDLQRGLALAQRVLEMSPLEETALRRVLALLDAAGDRAGAESVYQAFRNRLSADLGVEPAPETQMLMVRVRGRSLSLPPDRRAADEEAAHGAPGVGKATVIGLSREAPAEGKGLRPGGWNDRPGKRLALAGSAGIFLLAALGGIWYLSSPTDQGMVIRSVAVLPFANLSADPENEFISDGVSEEILSALSQIEGLRVPARTSAFRFKGTDVDVQEVAAQLGVEAIVEGSVRLLDGRIRVSTRLVDAQTGYQLWSRTYDRRSRDIFAVQEEIARSIVHALAVRLRTEESERLARRSTDDIEAQTLYLKGRYLLLNRRSQESMALAASHFQQAVARDSGFAAAHAGLADVYTLTAVRGYAPQAATLAKARAAIERALQFDSTSAEVRTSYAYILESQHEWAAAEREFQRALADYPGYVTARYWYNGLLQAMGRLEEAIEQNKRALEVDPLSPTLYSNTGKSYRLLGQRDSAIAYYRKALEISPHYGAAQRGMARLHAEAGDFQRADSLIRAANPEGDRGTGEAEIYARIGRPDEVRRILRKAVASPGAEKSPVPGLIYELLEERDSAIAWLSDAEWGINWIIDIQADPQWKPLRSDPRFAPILSRLNLRPPTINEQFKRPAAGTR